MGEPDCRELTAGKRLIVSMRSFALMSSLNPKNQLGSEGEACPFCAAAA